MCIKWCGSSDKNDKEALSFGRNKLFTGGLDNQVNCFDVEKK
jgi:hypothetical protein